MEYKTHILKDDSYDGLVTLVTGFLSMNVLWAVTGQVQYNEQENYYYQGVIQTSGDELHIVRILPATLNQILFNLNFYVNSSVPPKFIINGQEQVYSIDFTITNGQLEWISNDFSLESSDRIMIAFDYVP